MLSTRLCALLIASLTVIGCDDISSVKTATLSVEPDDLVFSKPEGDAEEQRLSVELRNLGNGPLIVASIRLSEEDDVPELSLLDADDWSSPVTIQPEDSRRVTVAWSMRDAQADLGRLVIQHNAGPDRLIPISTPDIDPVISVETEPDGNVRTAGTDLVLDQTSAGRIQKVRVELTSMSIAPLDVRNICVLNRDGRCAEEGLDETGAYRVCGGDIESPEGCSVPSMGLILRQNETYIFSIFYTPLETQDGVIVGQVLVESNDAIAPQYQIELRGQVCVRDVEGRVCDGCGDGVIGPGETCDDGNINNDDDCRNDCTTSICGDGIVREGMEECDDGNDINTDGCLSNCLLATCGDGHVRAESDEECDDGNENDSDTCLNDCRVARCGDGVVQDGVEVCDDGNDSNSDGCLSNCQSARCGDGIVMDFFEECDDANGDNTDACLSDCRRARCGDGFIQAGLEECDDANSNTESCPYGEPNCVVCDADCQEVPGETAFCGDGQTQAPEECDGGGVIITACEYDVDECQVCNAECVFVDGEVSFCGDGQIQGPEECDDGNNELEACDYGVAACTICDPNCTERAGDISRCGDGVVNGPEVCDGGPDCAMDCLGERPPRGQAQYGDPCDCGNDCASGLCVINPRFGRGQCTQECFNGDVCPGIDNCVQGPYPAPQGQCPDPGLDFEVGELVDICVPNETGIPCLQPEDCPFDGVCLSPPNPLPGQVFVPSQCAARCERDNQCPTGYRCEEVRDQFGGMIRLCNANVDITSCPGGNQNLCGGLCRTRVGENEASVVACVVPTNARDGFCSCLCATADDCPRGFGCSPQYASGNPARPFACIPMAGYICPEGNQNLCLGESCLFDPETGLNQCTSACRNEADCPQGFRCLAIPGSPFNYCAP